jgi:hypothetical protein
MLTAAAQRPGVAAQPETAAFALLLGAPVRRAGQGRLRHPADAWQHRHRSGPAAFAHIATFSSNDDRCCIAHLMNRN